MDYNATDITTRRLPAEWEADPAILMAWPHEDTDWAPMLDEARHCVTDIARAIASTGRTVIMVTPDPSSTAAALDDLADSGRLVMLDYVTNDTWARDFGPITTIDTSTGNPLPIDYQFNGWGLKFAADRDNLVNLALVNAGIIKTPIHNRRSFILEGGSIDTDGLGLLITTEECLLSPNRNGSSTKDEIETELRDNLGVKHVIWLRHGSLLGDDTDSHVDTLARFAPGHKLVYNTCLNADDANYSDICAMGEEILALAPSYGITPIGLPLPAPVSDPDDGHQLPATYANFLALPEAVIMPTYRQPEADARAAAILADAFCKPVIEVDCSVLIRQHGSLHCMTMQIPERVLIDQSRGNGKQY